MMRRNLRYLFSGFFLILLAAVLFCFLSGCREKPSADIIVTDCPAAIFPDYNGVVLPANIAPLNFTVKQPGERYYVKIYSKNGRPVEVFSRTGKIIIPQKSWRSLLDINRGHDLYFDIYVKAENRKSTIETRNWKRYSVITNRIAVEDIDSFLVYRNIYPVLSKWRQMGIYQRDLSSFDETTVLSNKSFTFGCVNCHAFCNYKTDGMLIGIRGAESGTCTIFADAGKVGKIDTKFGYTSWHPSGKLAVYSMNKVRQFYHTARDEVRDVIDLDSSLGCFYVDSKQIKIPEKIAEKDRLETYPAWSPDGRYLYFCSGPILWEDRNKIPPENYDKLKYDLRRVSYDIATDRWGEVETILSAEDTGLSISQPKISPDGRWLLFCMSNYGSFMVYHKSSDLYLVDLKAAEETGRFEYRRLEINSDESESWHSFSSNSRWIAFSSKRDYGIFTRTYISYIDKAGKVYKPLLLPQKDPEFYDSYIFTYSVPEFVIEPVKVKGEQLGRVVCSRRKLDITIPVTMATPKVDANDPWQHRE